MDPQYSSASALLERLDALPRLGWVGEASPVTVLDGEGAAVGVEWLGIKRDDRLEALCGGSKVRKLDYLLAAAPWAEAPGWVSIGAINSGHLVALGEAAACLDKRMEVVTFWTPPSERTVPSLAHIATHADRVLYRHSRVRIGLRHPLLLTLGRGWRGLIPVSPGGTDPAGVLGTVRAGVELAAQIERGEVPPIDRVVVPYGTGGISAGLALGLGLAGLERVEVVAVAITERIFATRRNLDAVIRDVGEQLVRAGVLPDPAAVRSAPLRIVREALGRGYGHPTPASTAACDAMVAHGLHLEPVYSGKAMAAVLAGHAGAGRVLFWLTPGRTAPEPTDDAWRERLPRALRRRLGDPRAFTRRRWILGGVAATTALTVGLRVTGYPDWPAWPGRVLAVWEGHVLRAVVEALLPPAPLDPGVPERVAMNVDRYVLALPSHARLELHAALAAVEHGTTPLTLRWSRLTELPVEEAREYLATLAARGGVQRQMYRGVRDLVMLGYYQQARTWPALGYEGPKVDRRRRPTTYDPLAARAGDVPRGWSAE